MSFKIDFKTKWSDFDANKHMRHTAYNDFAAEARLRFFLANGYNLASFNKLQIGPILFKEETNFYREISLGQDITVELAMKGYSEAGERWKISHNIIKADGVVAATIEVYGAWLDLKARKLCKPPENMTTVFNELPRTADFEMIPLKKK